MQNIPNIDWNTMDHLDFDTIIEKYQEFPRIESALSYFNTVFINSNENVLSIKIDTKSLDFFPKDDIKNLFQYLIQNCQNIERIELISNSSLHSIEEYYLKILYKNLKFINSISLNNWKSKYRCQSWEFLNPENIFYLNLNGCFLYEVSFKLFLTKLKNLEVISAFDTKDNLKKIIFALIKSQNKKIVNISFFVQPSAGNYQTQPPKQNSEPDTPTQFRMEDLLLLLLESNNKLDTLILDGYEVHGEGLILNLPDTIENLQIRSTGIYLDLNPGLVNLKNKAVFSIVTLNTANFKIISENIELKELELFFRHYSENSNFNSCKILSNLETLKIINDKIATYENVSTLINYVLQLEKLNYLYFHRCDFLFDFSKINNNVFKIKLLEIKMSNISTDTLVNLVKVCPQLKKISLHCCNNIKKKFFFELNELYRGKDNNEQIIKLQITFKECFLLETADLNSADYPFILVK